MTHSAALEQVTPETPEPITPKTPESVRPALRVVRARQAAKRHGLTFRWQMDPVERRLVQVWEPCD
jgi:hypothetical protein